MGKGEQTKERILEIAERAVLENGFAGTSIEGLIAEAGITKSGFFYHFKDKAHLIENMIRRNIANDTNLFDKLFARADELVEDPLQRYLLFLNLLAEEMGELPSTNPGCIIASICYAHQSYISRVSELNKMGLESWREMFSDRLQEIADIYPPDVDIDLAKLTNALTVIIEGALILTRVYKDKNILPEQILLHRNHVKHIFTK